MNTTATILFSIALRGSLALLAHADAVYPLMMRWLARGRRLPDDRFEHDAEPVWFLQTSYAKPGDWFMAARARWIFARISCPSAFQT